MTDTLSQGVNQQGSAVSFLSLVERARAGESAAFEQLMVCTQHKVAATAWRLLGDREDTRDATQEVFLRAYKYLKSYRPDQDFHGWLYRITVNVCRDMLRRTRRGAEQQQQSQHAAFTHADAAQDSATLDTFASDSDTEEAAALSQKRAIVRRALATLPEKERTAIVLRDLEGRSTEEVARLMNSRPGTVRSQVSTARSKIKIYCERFLSDRRRPGETL
jgi:RNA polymerase sigma-70 factor (ECF subfamily)